MLSYLEFQYGILIRKQSLDSRFSDKCVGFVKSVLKEVMQERLSRLYTKDFLFHFGRVRIKDSTKFKVPSNLSDEYKSCGGSAETFKAGVSIQYEYDMKSGLILDLTITSANRHDAKDAVETVGTIIEGDLVIRDLGYYGIPVFRKIAETKAYFLSRLHSSTVVFDTEGNPLCFQKIYKKMTLKGENEMEMEVLVGEKEKFKVRLILQIVPQQVYEQRIRKREKLNKNRGYSTHEETKVRYKFNLFITNIEEDILPAKNVLPLYKLRWQVELMFKSWKSVFEVHKIHKMKKERYLCMLYVRLLLIVINLQIVYKMQTLLYKRGCKSRIENRKPQERILSIYKCLKTLKYFQFMIIEWLSADDRRAGIITREIQEILSKNHWLECKKNKLCFPQIIDIFICKSDE